MDSKLDILQHALGLDEYGRGNSYRNFFATGPGSEDFAMCRELVASGLMTEHRGNALSGGNPVFTVTPAGREFVKCESPQPPKLTRSQQRYRDYLAEDGCLSFREWLGIKPNRAPLPHVRHDTSYLDILDFAL